ncbi:hypothetical protein [Streptomyces nojiriensis]|uniref:hypothetical protein n=1 Tax=Streptomyces nojiriensis TaxID=66374 RepID=UPI0035D6DF47
MLGGENASREEAAAGDAILLDSFKVAEKELLSWTATPWKKSRISELFLSSGPCRLRRTPGEAEAQVYGDVRRSPDEGGYLDPGEQAEDAGAFLR